VTHLLRAGSDSRFSPFSALRQPIRVRIPSLSSLAIEPIPAQNAGLLILLIGNSLGVFIEVYLVELVPPPECLPFFRT
jgi:hypothetical protein